MTFPKINTQVADKVMRLLAYSLLIELCKVYVKNTKMLLIPRQNGYK